MIDSLRGKSDMVSSNAFGFTALNYFIIINSQQSTWFLFKLKTYIFFKSFIRKLPYFLPCILIVCSLESIYSALTEYLYNNDWLEC